MRNGSKLLAVGVIAVVGVVRAPGQQVGGPVGQRVITRVGTVLKVGRQVVDDPYRRASGHADDRATVPT
jgi:hypothetical protein